MAPLRRNRLAQTKRKSKGTNVLNGPKQISSKKKVAVIKNSKKMQKSTEKASTSKATSSQQERELASNNSNSSSSSNNSMSSNNVLDWDNSSTTLAELLRRHNNNRNKTSTPMDVDHDGEQSIENLSDIDDGFGSFGRQGSIDGTTSDDDDDDSDGSIEEEEEEENQIEEDQLEDNHVEENQVQGNGVAMIEGEGNQDEKEQEIVRWIEECSFVNKILLNEFLNKENCWSYRGCNDTVQGQKVLYRCNRVKRASRSQCAAGIYVIEKIVYGTVDGGEVTKTKTYILYRKSTPHTHDQLPSVVAAKLNKNVKDLILAQYDDGRKPKKIFYNLLKNDDIQMIDKPTHKQVVSVINSYKKSNYGEQPITMRQLTNFVEKHNKRPKNVDEAFIIRYEKSPRNVREEKYFRFFISTPRLLYIASKSTIIHADATHKVTTEKLPLIAVGVTDESNNFHFSGLTLANHEAADDYALTFRSLRSGARMVAGTQIQPKALICDADSAIHNGFGMVFGDDDDDSTPPPYIIIMCYFHVTLNIQTKYKFQMKNNKTLFKNDVYILHLCDTETKFDIGCGLFVEKWRIVEPEATRLIQKSFFQKNKNWFIGCFSRVPKHNNDMESFNSSMKRSQLEHQRQPLKKFLYTALSIVRERSLEYLKGKVAFQSELQIDKDMMKRGCELQLKFVHGDEKPDGTFDFYAFCSAMQDTEISLDVVDNWYKNRYKTFAEFSSKAFIIWKIIFQKGSNRWREAVCTCPSFDANFICKHIISIAFSLGLVAHEVEEDYDDEPLFVVGRGRPKRTSKALIVE